jgi:DNA-binding NtrC family response regulator
MIKDDEWDVILCDVKMPKRDGIEVLELGLKHNPELQFIMISGHANIDTAVECTKKGAYDFIQKPPDLNRSACVRAQCHGQKRIGHRNPHSEAKSHQSPRNHR